MTASRPPMRLVIVGGVAGGASAATRARRLSESAEIIILEKGPHVSFANCGLPYHIGGVIPEQGALIVQTPQSLKARFNIDVRTNNQVLSIDRKRKLLKVLIVPEQREYELSYDKLILAPGAEAFRPPLPGLNLENVFNLQTITEMNGIISWIKNHQVKHATVLGAGFIGVEVAENLRQRGLAVSMIELGPQVLPNVDRDMAELLHQNIRLHGVDLKLETKLTSIAPKVSTGLNTKPSPETCLTVNLEDKAGTRSSLNTHMVIVAAGVRPRTALAKEAGLQLGITGGIQVNERMETSDEHIYAAGDAVEVTNPISNRQVLIPLAGPANRQGRIAADQVFGRKDSRYRGTSGTSICKVFDLAAGTVGLNQKALTTAGTQFETAIIHPGNHAGYYPGSSPITFKMYFNPTNGQIFGAQAIGMEGVDKRIDVISTAIAGKLTVFDLEHLELAYAPPFNSAKDPVNMIGFVAANMIRGDHRPIQSAQLEEILKQSEYAPDKGNNTVLLDVRTLEEHEAGHIPGSILMPVDELRDRISQLAADKEYITYCRVGLRGYTAQRILTQSGFNARNLVGGYTSWLMYTGQLPQFEMPSQPLTTGMCDSPENSDRAMAVQTSPAAPSMTSGESNQMNRETNQENGMDTFVLNACGLQCPGPLMRMREKMDSLKPGQILKVIATDPGFPADAAAWCRKAGHKLISVDANNGRYTATISHGTSPADPATNMIHGAPTGFSLGNTTAQSGHSQQLSIIVFNNDMDKAMAAFIIANGAAAMGMKVVMFFTFWGLSLLRKDQPVKTRKNLMEKMFGFMLPRGPRKLALSKMNMAGMGTSMMKHVMKQKNVDSLPGLLDAAMKNGARMVACTMSMDVMGLKREELIDGVEEGGVATYIESASEGNINLFI